MCLKGAGVEFEDGQIFAMYKCVKVPLTQNEDQPQRHKLHLVARLCRLLQEKKLSLSKALLQPWFYEHAQPAVASDHTHRQVDIRSRPLDLRSASAFRLSPYSKAICSFSKQPVILKTQHATRNFSHAAQSLPCFGRVNYLT